MVREFKYLIMIFILLTINFTAFAQQEKADKIKIGNPAPIFVLKSLDDNEVFLRDFCGDLRQPWKNKIQHVVIISFFATWCQPCMKEISELENVVANFKDKELKVFLIDLKEEKSVVQKFVTEKKFQSPVLLDKYGVVAQNYGVSSLPRLFVIDREGKIVWKTTGYQENIAKELTAILKTLLP